MTPFAAVLLAGGRGRRMGRDKALLPLPGGGLLWERQYRLLQALAPAALYLSGPRRAGFPASVRCLPDTAPDQGPLGGITVALEAMGELHHLVVLAVDLPEMSSGFLQALLAQVAPGAGMVPRHPDHDGGFYEPLAAVYPKECGSLARRCLQEEDRSLQSFVRRAGSLLQPFAIRAEQRALFNNWNTPADRSAGS